MLIIICLLILFSEISICQKYKCDIQNPKSWQYENGCQCDIKDIICSPKLNNELATKIRKIDINERNSQMSEIIHHYKLSEMVIKIGPFGNGIYLPQGLKKNSPLIKFDLNKIINDKRINYGIFFKNTLISQHKKLWKNNKMLDNHTKLILNLIYHYCWIDQSLQRPTLLEYRSDEIAPVFQIIEKERFLIQDDPVLLAYIDNKNSLKQSKFKKLQKIFQLSFSKEQFSLFFGKQRISYDEFIWIFIGNHDGNIKFLTKNKLKLAMIPIMNTAYHKESIRQGDMVQDIKRYNKIYQLTNTDEHDFPAFSYFYHYFRKEDYLDEILGHHHYIDENIKDCKQIQLMDEQQSKRFGLSQKNCINKETFPLYQKAFHELIIEQNAQSHTARQNSQLDIQQLDDFDIRDQDMIEQQSSDWQKMPVFIEQQIYDQFWKKNMDILDKEQQNLTKILSELHHYQNFRKENERSTTVARLLYNYYKLQFNEIMLIGYGLNKKE